MLAHRLDDDTELGLAGHHHDHHDHDHDHGHHHGHSHGHSHAPASFGRAFGVGIALNTAYVAAEAVYGVLSNSLALLADAGHNFGDVLGLAVAWLAAWLSRRAPSERFTYGLRGSSILAALTNAVVLLLVTGGIAWEAVLRLAHPEPAAGVTIMIVATVGVVINGATAMMFASGRKGDVNIRGAFLHMASDALIALGVVITGGLILMTRWLWLDPAISLVISAVIVWGTWSLMRESLGLALQGVPAGIDQKAVQAFLGGTPGVTEVHDLHIWGMSTTETALTAHLVRPEGAASDDLLHELCDTLRRRFSIAHATLQFETGAGAHPCSLAPRDTV
ncbi:MAG TPA: cation diffusion facilitator family transporter [Caulobacteraceae bacterium]|nr:cation diffusion facilitator family transporter [Caulobacteraceae bacterium]